MRVILLADVERLGHEGDIVEVRDGYARNYLIPRGLATRATKGALRDLELRREAIERRNLQKREAALAVAERVREQTVIIEAMVGERGRLHGRVTTMQIAQALQDQLGIAVDRRDIQLREPIKAAGDYVISAQLFKDVVVDIALRVVPMGAEEEEAEVEEIDETPAAEGTEEPAEEAQAQDQAGATEEGSQEERTRQATEDSGEGD